MMKDTELHYRVVSGKRQIWDFQNSGLAVADKPISAVHPRSLLVHRCPGFRAINCAKTPLVVEDRAWSEKYVALSYVWGPPSGDWPKTILDAVEVTKQLGEKYLWVYRLCINQSNLQEKQFLTSKMDAIYDGAEFTIVAAAGDARTGLTGVSTTFRKLQPLIDLKQRIRTDAPNTDPYMKMLGITTEEYEEISKDGEWLDLRHFGFKSTHQLDHEDIREFKREQEIMEIFGISREHLTVFQDMADDSGSTIEEWMLKMMDMSEREGIPMQELAPHIPRDIATAIGMPEEMIQNLKISAANHTLLQGRKAPTSRPEARHDDSSVYHGGSSSQCQKFRVGNSRLDISGRSSLESPTCVH